MRKTKTIKEMTYLHPDQVANETSAYKALEAWNNLDKRDDLVKNIAKDFPENPALAADGDKFMFSAMKGILNSSPSILSDLSQFDYKLITENGIFTGDITIGDNTYNNETPESKFVGVLLAYANLQKVAGDTPEEKLKNVLNDQGLSGKILGAEDNIKISDTEEKSSTEKSKNIDINDYKPMLDVMTAQFKKSLSISLIKELSIDKKEVSTMQKFLESNITDIQRENITMAYHDNVMQLLNKNMDDVFNFVEDNKGSIASMMKVLQGAFSGKDILLDKDKAANKIPSGLQDMFSSIQKGKKGIVDHLKTTISTKVGGGKEKISIDEFKTYKNKDIGKGFGDFNNVEEVVEKLFSGEDVKFIEASADVGPTEEKQKKFLKTKGELTPKFEKLREMIPHFDAGEMLDGLDDERFAQVSAVANKLSDGKFNDIMSWMESTSLGKFLSDMLSLVDIFMDPPILGVTYEGLKQKVAIKSLVGSYSVAAKKKTDGMTNKKSRGTFELPNDKKSNPGEVDKAKKVNTGKGFPSDTKIPSSYTPYSSSKKDALTGAEIVSGPIELKSGKEFSEAVQKDINIKVLSSVALGNIAGGKVDHLRHILGGGKNEDANKIVLSYMQNNIKGILESEKLREGETCTRADVLTLIFEDMLNKKKTWEEKEKNKESAENILDKVTLSHVTKANYNDKKISFDTSTIGTGLEYKVGDTWKKLDINTKIDMKNKTDKMQRIVIRDGNQKEKSLLAYWTDWKSLETNECKKDDNKYKVSDAALSTEFSYEYKVGVGAKWETYNKTTGIVKSEIGDNKKIFFREKAHPNNKTSINIKET